LDHALRSPIIFIQLYLDLIGRAKDDTQLDHYLRTMRQQAHDLQVNIDDLIYLMCRSASPLTLEAVSARLIAEEAISSVYSSAEDSQVRIQLRDEPDLPLIRADRWALERAIHNLLTRAILLSQPGDEVEVALGRHEKGVEIVVRDHAQPLNKDD
jgi:signal transduction histidine kinase